MTDVGRHDQQWLTLKIQFRFECRTVNAPCHLCVLRGDIESAQIDYSAPPGDPNAFTVDHVKPWKTHPHLRVLRSNLRAAHSRCNKQRRDDPLPETPQVWVKPDW